MDIKLYPASILREEAIEVLHPREKEASFLNLINNLIPQVFKDQKTRIGIAANQLNYRDSVFAIRDKTNPTQHRVFINPQINVLHLSNYSLQILLHHQL